MTDERFEAWKRARADGRVPEGFAARVMEAVERHRRNESGPFLLLLAAVLQSRVGRAAICSIVGAALILRIAGVLSVFLEV